MNNAMYKGCADDAAFLWSIRSNAVTDVNYNANDIAILDKRIDANLDGLMTSVVVSWPICLSLIETAHVGGIFTASIVAFKSNDMDKIKTIITAGLDNETTFNEIISALAWLPDSIIKSWLSRLLNSKDLNHKYLAIAAYSVRYEDPGEVLTKLFQREDCISHKKLYARSLRLIGELQRHDLKAVLNGAMFSKDENIAFWANWSAILLGNKSAVNNLKQFIDKKTIFQNTAIQIAFRVLPVDIARNWISEMVKNKIDLQVIIDSVAVLGDPHAINWLITIMRQPDYTQHAGVAFSIITGIDLEQDGLVIEQLNENNINNQLDSTLVWPDVIKIKTLWEQFGNSLKAGQRYFLGQPIKSEHLKNIILNGTQSLRHNAMLELAIMDSQYRMIKLF